MVLGNTFPPSIQFCLCACLVLVREQNIETLVNVFFFFYILVKITLDSRLIKVVMLAKIPSGPEMLIPTSLHMEVN